MGQRHSLQTYTGNLATNTQEGARANPTQVSQPDGSEGQVSVWRHECEWTEDVDAEAGFHLQLKTCQKNPGHNSFIPIGQFSIDHLPEGYRDEDIVEWTKLMADLTVKVHASYVSVDRPETCPDTEWGKAVPRYEDKVGAPYPFSAYKGSDIPRAGTAWVSVVVRYEGQCECEAHCPHKDGGEVKLLTARHVVFDDSEAEKAELNFHYDSEEDQKKIRVVRARGARDGSTEGDSCCIFFSSHDVEFLDWLEETLKRWNMLRDKLYWKYSEHVDARNLNFQRESLLARFPVIIVSHPHGGSKMVTVGRMSEVLEEEDKFRVRYAVFDYTADTCPGSSGAPVSCVTWSRSGDFSVFASNPHSAGVKDGLNRSAADMWC